MGFLAVGLIQGVLLSFLTHVYSHAGDLPFWWLASMGLSIYLPFSFYATAHIDGLTVPRRFGVVALGALVWVAASAYQVYTHHHNREYWPFNFVFPLWAFVFVHLGSALMAANQGGVFSNKRYALMFDMAWRSGLMLAFIFAVLLLVFGTLQLLGDWFNQIGLPTVHKLFDSSWLMFPILSVSGAWLASYMVRQDRAVKAIRDLILTSIQWLLPVLVLASCVWLVMLLVQFQSQFMYGAQGMVLLVVCALAIGFLNAAYRDGLSPVLFPAPIRALTQYLWPVFALIAGLSVYAVVLRINDYGLTVDRIVALVCALMLALYAFGYCVSLWPWASLGWMKWVGAVNIVAAACWVLLVPVLFSPLAYPPKLEVHNQTARLLAQKTEPQAFNYTKYVSHYGFYFRFGEPALQRLAEGVNHPERDLIAELAAQALAQASVVSRGESNQYTADDVADALHLAGREVPRKSLLKIAEALMRRSYNDATDCIKDTDCHALWVDVAPNHGDEVLVNINGFDNCFDVFTLREGEYEYIAEMCQDQARELHRLDRLNSQTPIEVLDAPWRVIDIDGKRFIKSFL